MRPHLLCVLLLQQLSNGRQLDIARPLVNSPNLAVTEVLFRQPLAHEPHTPHPLNCLARHLACNLRRHELGHGRVHDEVLAGLLLARSVVDKGARGLDLGPGLGELVLHGLKFANEGAELLAVVPGVAVGVCLVS